MGGSQSNDYTQQAASAQEQQQAPNISDYTHDAMENWNNDKILRRYGKLSAMHPIIQYTLKSRDVIHCDNGIVCIKYWYGPRLMYQWAGDKNISECANIECMGNHWTYDFFDKETGEYLADSHEGAKAKQVARLDKIEKEKEQKRREEEERRQEEASKIQEEQRRQEEAKKAAEEQQRQEQAKKAAEEQAKKDQEEQTKKLAEEQQRQEQAKMAAEEQVKKGAAEEQHRQEEAKKAQEEQQEQVQQQSTTSDVQNESNMTPTPVVDPNNNEVILSQEAETLLLEAVKIYEEGRLSEAAGRIRNALDLYVKSSSKLNEAASKKIVDNILNSYLKVITSMLRNEAYDEAKDVLESMQGFFPKHVDEFRVIREAIDNQEWSADYLKEKLLSEDLYREIIGHL